MTKRRLLALSLLTGLLLTACGGGDDESVPGAASLAKFEVGHVHTLALVNDTVLIGTHEGLFAESGDGVKLLGEKFDVMGMFAVDGVVYSSGHPDETAADKRDLGLRRSTDGGATWEQVSLLGAADFHRLVVAGSVLMGINSHDGQLLRSEDDGKTWSALGQVPIFDLAMDPTNDKLVLATTEKGLITSTDGGRTWGAPFSKTLLMFVAFTEGGLLGVTPEGEVYRQGEDGWVRQGAIDGQPEAFATDAKKIVVAVGGKVLESSDFGKSFSVRVTGLPGH